MILFLHNIDLILMIGKLGNNNMKKILVVLLSLLFLALVNTAGALDIVDDETYFHVQNEIYNVTISMPFSRITIDVNYITFNDSSFYITSTNPINITFDYIKDTILATSDGTKVMSFYAYTLGGTGVFQITGFDSSRKYKIRREGVVYATIMSDVAGVLTFTNTEWSGKYIEIFTGGGPAAVTLTVVDNTINDICAEISITNEGIENQEYFYYYWITPRADGDLLDPDTVDSASASKLVAPGEIFTVTVCLTVNTPETYWYKVRVYWGVEYSSASEQFDAVIPEGAPGGGAAPRRRPKLTVVCVDRSQKSLDSVRVEIYEGGRLLGTDITDNEGKALFVLPKPMTVTIRASKNGYDSVEQTVSVKRDKTVTLTMTEPVVVSMLPWVLVVIIAACIIICFYYYYSKKRPTKNYPNTF